MQIFFLLSPVLAAFSLQFTVQHGGSHAKAAKRHDADVGLDEADNDLYYVAEIEVGSKHDKVQVVLDTESADTWVPSSDCKDHDIRYDIEINGTAAGNPRNETIRVDYDEYIPKGNPTPISYFTTRTTVSGFGSSMDGSTGATYTLAGYRVEDVSVCTQHGSFNTDASDSIKREGDWLISPVGPDDTYYTGFYVNDDVTLGETTIKQLRFGAVDSTNLDIGTLGLGLPQSLDMEGDSVNKKYQSLLSRLKTDKVIDRLVYSLSLSEEDDSGAEVLFGAIDSSKYVGELQRVPILNRFKAYEDGIPLLPEIALDAITGSDIKIENRIAVSLASRYYGSYLPEAYVSKIGEHLNGTLNSYGYWVISCDYLSSNETFTFHFSGQEVEVPLIDLIVQSSSKKVCFLGLYREEVFPKLGINFLRNAYVVFDLENNEIALAQATQGSSESQIVDITSEIPDATTASGYSNTAVNDYVTSVSSSWTTVGTTVEFGSTTTSGLSSSSSSAIAATRTVGLVFRLLNLMWVMLL